MERKKDQSSPVASPTFCVEPKRIHQIRWTKEKQQSTDIKKLVKETLANVTWGNRGKAVLHIRKIEKASCEVDFGTERLQWVGKVFILLNSESSDRGNVFSASINENLPRRCSVKNVFFAVWKI